MQVACSGRGQACVPEPEIEAAALEPFTINLYAALASPLVGSAIAAGAQRFAEGRAWDATPSACPSCRRVLALSDMAPVVSWLALRGKCRSCQAPISASYPVIELVAVGVAVWAWLATPPAAFAFTCMLGWLLLALAATDIRTRRLPDVLTLATLVVGLIAAAILDRELFLDHLLGAALGYSAFVAVETAYRWLRKIDGLGRGDAKLLAAIGAWVGWQGLPSVVLVASATAIGVILISGWMRREQITAVTSVAFGPFLALAGWLVWIGGPVIF
jgi:leader peptidase (prepilin peptidase)/N-methyltransferase